MLNPEHEIPFTISASTILASLSDMNASRLSRGLVLVSWGASLLACVLRVHRIYLVKKQGPGTGHATERLSARYYYAFLSIVIVHGIISLGTGISFGVLALIKGDDWLVFTSGSVVLWSMIGQVRVLSVYETFHN